MTMTKALQTLSLLALTLSFGCAEKYFYPVGPEPVAALRRVSGTGLAGCWQSELSPDRPALMYYQRVDAQNYLMGGPPETPKPGYAYLGPVRVRVKGDRLLETTYQNVTDRYDYTLDGDRLVKHYRLDSDFVPPEEIAAGRRPEPSAYFRVAESYCRGE